MVKCYSRQVDSACDCRQRRRLPPEACVGFSICHWGL